MKNLVFALMLAPGLAFADANFNIVSFDISFGGGKKDTKTLNILGYRQSLSLSAAQAEGKEPITKPAHPLIWVAVGGTIAAVAVLLSDDDDDVEEIECSSTDFVFGSTGSMPTNICR